MSNLWGPGGGFLGEISEGGPSLGTILSGGSGGSDGGCGGCISGVGILVALVLTAILAPAFFVGLFYGAVVPFFGMIGVVLGLVIQFCWPVLIIGALITFALMARR